MNRYAASPGVHLIPRQHALGVRRVRYRPPKTTSAGCGGEHAPLVGDGDVRQGVDELLDEIVLRSLDSARPS